MLGAVERAIDEEWDGKVAVAVGEYRGEGFVGGGEDCGGGVKCLGVYRWMDGEVCGNHGQSLLDSPFDCLGSGRYYVLTWEIGFMLNV